MRYLNRMVVAASIVAVTAVSARPAFAQGFIPSFRIRAGIFMPHNSSLSTVTGNTWLKGGVDVSLPGGLAFFGGNTRASIDYVVKSSSTIVPITISTVMQPSIGLHSPVYAGAGVGVWTGHIKGSGTSSRFGLRLLGGLDISRNMFIEAHYDFVDKLGGVRADGLSVMAGVRF